MSQMNNCSRQNPAYRPTPTRPHAPKHAARGTRVITFAPSPTSTPLSPYPPIPFMPPTPPQADLRPPEQVMRLARLGSFHQTRLSFMRALLRDLKRANWQFTRARWEIDARGVGFATYHAQGAQHQYTLICFAHDLPPQERSDRVIAERWDATFALYDGEPDDREIARLNKNVPLQEAGHYHPSELVLARANRSVRLFDNVVAQLAQGNQPNPADLAQSGYLMRTTAVYGNGKFGLSDRERIMHRPEFRAPFRAELLAVWLIRWFTIDLAEHLARAQNPRHAAPLNREIARQLGVGNATGLGMAPFLLHHPSLLHRWIHARETALARVRALPTADDATRAHFTRILARMQLSLQNWRTTDARQSKRIKRLTTDLTRLQTQLKTGALQKPAPTSTSTSKPTPPWDALIRWSETALSLEGQELLVSLVLEPHAELIDDLTDCMASDENRYWRIHGQHDIRTAIAHIERDYGWALPTDYRKKAECARFWYVSEEKLEPRLGERFTEPGADQELPLSFARDIKALYTDLKRATPPQPLSEFLRTHPHHRHALRRVQIAARLPYAEIRDNLISAHLLPIDLLRCKLSFFGANRFDPKSDRWVRITMYQHAPLPDEIAHTDADDWSYPPLATTAATDTDTDTALTE